MIFTLHLCSPAGEALRLQMERAMGIVKDDNKLLISALLRDGTVVPDTMDQYGVEYDDRRDRAGDAGQELYGLTDILKTGKFSCGDASALEAAILEVKYGIPATCLATHLGNNQFHATYVTPSGPVDPVANFLALRGIVFMPGSRYDRPAFEGAPNLEACRVDPATNTVQCDVQSPEACVVNPKTLRWECPTNPEVNGKKVKLLNGARLVYGRADNGTTVPLKRS